MTNDELIEEAARKLNPRTGPDNRLFGDVAAALVSEKGDLYTGVCVDTASWGLCAERSAIAAMATAGEYRIRRIVAVWRDERDGKLSVLPPCGVCREFIRRIDEANLDTEVVLGRETVASLRDLLPHHAWPEPIA
jgi:cytidine deaminase